MSNEVVSLSPGRDMREFFNFLYGDETGFVYSPTKDGNANWEKSFFEWPEQATELIKHCMAQSSSVDVYIGPALYSKPTGRKEDIKGTNVFWTEFDGKLPSAEILGEVPSPSWRVQSSEAGHEHFYWRLDSFETSVEVIERANRGLTYSLGGDTSAWDANQVLRPISTFNHKRNQQVFTLLKNNTVINSGMFSSIPIPPTVVGAVDLSTVPDALDVISQNKFTKEVFDFFRKPEIPVGSRSSAMMRLAFHCTEMQLSDTEAFSLLLNADERWGKFKGRNDQSRRLLDLINKARIKFPFTGTAPVAEIIVEEEWPIFKYKDFLAADIHVEWFIEGLLQRAGFLLLTGPSGLGKTQLSLQWAIHLALGRPFLGFEAGLPAKIIFFSMEMGQVDLQYFVNQMDLGLTDEDRDNLQNNLTFIPTGFGIMLDDKKQQKRVEDLTESIKPDGVFFDSLGVASQDDLSNESTIKTIMEWNARFRSKYNAFTWFIHHNRKAQANNKKPNRLEDVYGSLYITSNASTVIGLWPKAEDIEVTGLKIRLAPQMSPFTISRQENLSFKRNAELKLAKEIVTPVLKKPGINLNDI